METPTATTAGGLSPVIIAVPLLVIVVAVAAILALVAIIVLLLKKRSRRRGDKGGYNLLPTADGDKQASPPRTVRLGDPPMQPGMLFTTAPQLGSSTASGISSRAGAMRYPFVQHRIPGPQATLLERRHPRLRTRRKGNHKHAFTRQAVSPNRTDDQDSGSQEERNSPPRPHVYLLPAQNQPGTKQNPEVYLTLFFSKVSAAFVVRVNRVAGLPLREDGTEVNAYVQLYLTPVRIAGPQRRSSKTQTARRTSAPVFDEEIRFEAMGEGELLASTLHVEALDYKVYGKHQLLGGNTLALNTVNFQEGEATTTLPLLAPQRSGTYGGVALISLCYERQLHKLTVIFLRAKDLNGGRKETDTIAKLCIMLNDKPVNKLKTKRRTGSANPIFNEALSAIIDPAQIHNVKITVTVLNDHKSTKQKELGVFTFGSGADGDRLRHWNDTLAAGGKHIAEWHELSSL